MISILRPILLGAVLLTAAQGDNVSSTLKGIEERYNSAKTLEVSFTETFRQRSRTIAQKGTLYLRKPQKMLWRYTSPKGRLFVVDGKSIYDYAPGDKQVERVPFKETDDMRAPLAFLLGNLNFHEDFKDQFSIATDGTITALAKSDKFPYTEVSFLAGPDFVIHKLTVKLQDNSVIEYQFEDEKRNQPLADSLFRFTAPPGVQVVEATK
ncbi:MAG: LolA family protein [Bryobacteraceae bacterium]